MSLLEDINGEEVTQRKVLHEKSELSDTNTHIFDVLNACKPPQEENTRSPAIETLTEDCNKKIVSQNQ